MVISFELSQVIERPVGDVFAFLSDYSNMSYWNYYIQSVLKESHGEVQTGTIYKQKRDHDINYYKVVAYEPPKNVAVELQPPKPLQQYGFEIEPVNGNSHVTYKWQVDLRKYKSLKFVPDGQFKNWLLSFVRKHILTRIKPATEQNFGKLKTLLEKGEVTLQDGRKIILTGK